MKKEKELDWWDKISAEEKVEIDEGLTQADNGDVVLHNQVMEKHKKWL
jgi:predicted transcriptional regulator